MALGLPSPPTGLPFSLIACPAGHPLARTGTATDECNNSSNETQTVTVVDTTAPVIPCPSDIGVQLPDSTDPAATGVATASDNCDDAPDVTYGSVESSPVQYCPTVTIITRTWSSVDDCDNSADCDQLITVTDFPVPEGQCCDPTNGSLTTIDDGDDCTADICDDATGDVTHPNNGLCGACCLVDKECIAELLEGTCNDFGGYFLGRQSVCLGDSDGDGNDDQCDNCPGVSDAVFGFTICEVSGGACEADEDCPPEESCIPACQTAIPTVSQWGLIILALLLPVGAKIRFARNRTFAP